MFYVAFEALVKYTIHVWKAIWYFNVSKKSNYSIGIGSNRFPKWVKYFYPWKFIQNLKKRHTRETWFILLLRVTNTSFVFILFIFTQFCYPFSASSLMLRLENCNMYTPYVCKFFKEYDSIMTLKFVLSMSL